MNALDPIDPAELSGLLDGELPPELAARVRAALDANSELRAQYDALCVRHAAWQKAARSATFAPDVSQVREATERRWAWPFCAVAAILIGIKFLTAIAPFALGVGAHALVLCVILGLVLRQLSSPAQYWPGYKR